MGIGAEVSRHGRPERTDHLLRVLQLAPAAAVLGAVSGLAAALLRLGFRGLQWCFTRNGVSAPAAAASLPAWERVAVPMAGALCATLVLFARRKASGGGQPAPFIEYVEAVRRRHGRIPLVPNLWRTGSAAFSVATGAAVGREGSMIQFAAAVTSTFQNWLRGLRLAHLLPAPALAVACGVAGGVTTAYMAPVAGAFFAAEIVLGQFRLDELPLLALASFAGWRVSVALLGAGPLYPVQVHLDPAGLRAAFWLLPLLALFIGALGPAYQLLLRSLARARRLPLALVAAGAVVGGLSLLDPRVWGNGESGLSAALGHASLPGLSITASSLAMLLLLRLAATTLCVGAGTVGGVFTPTLFAGGTVGALAAWGLLRMAVPADPTLCAIVGMSALIAAATHAPVMAAFMTVELTGEWKLLPALLLLDVCAWLLARKLSPAALYAIASQEPVHRGLAPSHRWSLRAKR